MCGNCGKPFDHYESFFTDICDPCAEILEGKKIAELEKADSKHDDHVLTK